MNKAKVCYIFFNCDEYKTYKSMNVLYNTTVYKDTRDSRRELWKKVKSEIESEMIIADNSDINSIKQAILTGNPTDVNDMLTYGAIICMDLK